MFFVATAPLSPKGHVNCSPKGLEFVEEREVMDRWVENKGLDNLPAYRREKNARSIDGLRTAGFDGEDGPLP